MSAHRLLMRTLCSGGYAAVLLFALSSAAIGSEATAGQRDFVDGDEALWRTVQSSALTPDGKWLIYSTAKAAQPCETDCEAWIVQRSVFGSTERRFPAGDSAAGAGAFKVSPSGRWFAFRAMAYGKAAGIVLVETRSGTQLKLPEARDCVFTGHYLVYVDAEGLHRFDLISRRAQSLDPKVVGSAPLSWSIRGSALAVQSDNALVLWRGLEGPEPTRTQSAASEWAGFPRGYELSNTPIQWRSDEQGLFFGIRPIPKLAGATVPDLVLWHWQDAKLPQQHKTDAAAGGISYLSYLSLPEQQVVQLADSVVEEVTPASQGQYVLGLGRSGAWWKHIDPIRRSSIQADFYLVDLATGKHRRVIDDLRTTASPALTMPPRLSPDGAFLVYQEQGDYFVYDTATGARRNLTAGLPVKFYYDLSLQPRYQVGDSPNAVAFQGWTHDGRYILLGDYRDVWAFPLREQDGKPINLTGTGRRDGIAYCVTTLHGFARLDYETYRVDLDRPVYFAAFELASGRQGIARRRPGGRSAELLFLEDAENAYFKARDAEVFLTARSTATRSTDFHRLGATWRPERRLSDLNPQERTIRRSGGRQYLTYQTARGETLHAILTLPMGYEPGRRYPAVMSIYELQSSFVGRPLEVDDYHWLWLRNGYVLIQPDIRPRMGEPGRAALEAVTAAVRAASATGIVDTDRLGLTGHSFGSYATAFIVTQTELFKAAIPEAGFTDLVSFYGGLYGDEALGYVPASQIAQNSQGYMLGPWWEHWNDFIANSPLHSAASVRTPLLIIHSDDDTLAPYQQSVAFFNTLRRMGGKPVVLLQYLGGNHGRWLHRYHGISYRDASRRKLQFFDHFLKGVPAPAWWTQGISYYAGQTPAPDASEHR